MNDIRHRWEVAVLASSIPDGLKVTCWAIRHYANRDGEACPSIGSIALDTKRNPRTIIRHLKRLSELGYIQRDAKEGVRGPSGHVTTRTTLLIPEATSDTLAVTSMDDTHSVTSSNGREVTIAAQGVTESALSSDKNGSSGDTLAVTQTNLEPINKTNIEPGLAPASPPAGGDATRRGPEDEEKEVRQGDGVVRLKRRAKRLTNVGFSASKALERIRRERPETTEAELKDWIEEQETSYASGSDIPF